MIRIASVLLLLESLVFVTPTGAAEPPKGPADLVVHHAKVVTLDEKSHVAEAVAIKDGRIIAIGADKDVLELRGPKTRVIDAKGRMVLPGLYDSHVHSVDAAVSEINESLPPLKSLKDAFAYIRKKAAATPEGEWIVLRYAFPTRLEEGRFPTKAELDEAAPRHPVLYHAGPAGMVNSMALKLSGVTKDTPNPAGGIVVKDPKTGEPTGMLRSASSVLKGVPDGPGGVSAEARREAVKKQFRMYNEHGLTSVADRDAGRTELDVYLALRDAGELTLRVNVARSFNPHGTREEIVKRLEELPGKDRRGGPTGVGDAWVRIGPLKMYMDGGMLNGTAYMREPWPPGETYQIVEDNYRGLLFIKGEQMAMVAEEAAKRKWQVTAHTAGEGAMDVLLDAYELADRLVPIKARRFCITHANFPSEANLRRCQRLGVCADVQPAWLYKDGATLQKVLGEKRIGWFSPYKTWLEYTVIGGGSDHMIKLDARAATNPWDPWLGIFTAVTRQTERGGVLVAEECLSREQALRLYTINNAYLNFEEKEKGTLEVGKLGDMIVIDRDVLTCPAKEILDTKVVLTVVDGQVVFEARDGAD